jgi:hypothetical protein
MAGPVRATRVRPASLLGASLVVTVLAALIPVAGAAVAATRPIGDASTHNAFSAIENQAMPGLSPANWPTVQFVASPPGVRRAANVSSNDLRYTVTFYDFSSAVAAKAFFKTPPGSMISFLRGAMGYSSLGLVAVPYGTIGVDLRSCVGEGTDLALFPDGRCSDGSPSFSIGVGTITQRGPVVMMVGYLRDNARTPAASPRELARDVKIAESGADLLQSIGIGTR